jgi:hypothetical protein
MERIVVNALAVYRLTRFVTRDELAEPVRKVIEKEINLAAESRLISQPVKNKLLYLLGCDWCMSFWVAVLALTAENVFPRLWKPASKALAFSAVSGFLAGYE